MKSRLTLLRALAAAAVLATMPLLTVQAASPAPESPTYGPASGQGVNDQLGRIPGQGTVAPRTTGVAPFLTRPYWHAHTVTSIFDHCNPDYTQDGKVCEFDGTVALKTSGVDPTFTRGYAITPGQNDYLYYDGHNGWDYALNYEPVIAAAAGTVQIAGVDSANPGFGLNVTIDHGNGYTTRYAHMSDITVSPGQQVDRGESLGTSGNTGNSTGPHLHFGVYLNSPWTAIDPWGWTGAGTDPWPADTGNLWVGGAPQDPAPSAPTGVTATVSGNTATISWTAPNSTGGLPLSTYSITASPGGTTAVVSAASHSASIACLAWQTAYTFTVTAANTAGPGPASAPSNQVTTMARSASTAPAPGGGGYNILTSSGAIYSFCDATYHGNLLDHGYPGPGVGLAETPDGGGYNILTSTGAIYSFGNAQYFGNLLDHGYPGPATALAYTATGGGYTILTRGGGIYTFGDARYYGNLIDHHYPGTAVGLAYSPTGNGYSILTAEGGLYSFGDATYWGNLIDNSLPGTAASINESRDGKGYGILTTDGHLYTFGSQPYMGNLLDHGYPGPAQAVSNTP